MNGAYLPAVAIYLKRKRVRLLPNLELLEIGHLPKIAADTGRPTILFIPAQARSPKPLR